MRCQAVAAASAAGDRGGVADREKRREKMEKKIRRRDGTIIERVLLSFGREKRSFMFGYLSLVPPVRAHSHHGRVTEHAHTENHCSHTLKQ